jgi:hypothetical protein
MNRVWVNMMTDYFFVTSKAMRSDNELKLSNYMKRQNLYVCMCDEYAVSNKKKR